MINETKMKKVATLSFSKFKRKYNDVLRKKLEAAGISFTTKGSGGAGGYLMVSEQDFTKANKIVLSISHSNPKY